jgi:iron complex outermembrane receptor protein
MEKKIDLWMYLHPTLKKLIMELKIAILIIVVSVSNVFATPTYSQEAKVSLNMENKSLGQVLDEIESQSEFYFIFNQKQIDVNRVVNIQEDNKLITDILPELFKGTNVNYVVFDRKILLTTDPIENNLLAIASGTEPQQKNISGTVTDASTGEVLAGVNILVKGTTIGAISDVNGKYSITSALDQNATLVFSFIGYVKQEIAVAGKTVINAAIAAELTNLDEVVVIGYGTQTKRDISASVTNVSEKDFNQGANIGALDLLQGKVAGLDIFTNSSDVTSEPTVSLRGISSLSGAVSPFYVIDGVPGMDINSVATQDIESISVLKDASASAIYGSRAASGVILVTTKKGKSGQMNVEYSAKAMFGFAADKPPLLSASEYRAYAQKVGIDISASDLGVNTDWFKEITNEGAFSQEHYISASGGTEKSNYRASINYQDNEGIIKGNFMTRYKTLLAFDQKALKDKLDVSFTVGASKNDNRGIGYYGSIYTLLPTWPVKNPDGTWFETYDWTGGNPVHSIAENQLVYKDYLLYGNLKVNLEIFKGFIAGLNLFSQRGGNDTGSSNGMTTFEGNNDHGDASRYSNTADRDVLEYTMKYSKEINKNKIEILGGYSYEHYQNQYSGAQVRGFITNAFGYNDLSAGDPTKYLPGDTYSGGDMSKLIGFFGRLNYNFNDKYLLAATLRRDGSSKFGANNKWGTFPSVSVAWRILDEPFMERLRSEFLSDLKLRLSYGVTGNQDGISPYNSLALYSTGPLYYNNGNWQSTYQYSQNPNPNLKWEQTATLNAGLDFSFYKDRISGTVDFYNRKTSDLLYTYPVPVPPYLYPTILANVGDISNKGIELVINADIIRNQDFRWSVSFNVAHNKQLITKLSNDEFKVQNTMVGLVTGRGQSGSTTSILREGEEISTFYGLKCLGLDENGMYIFQDVDKNDTIDSRDYQVIGHAMPKATYGITSTISYKGFELSFFLRGVYGNDIFNNDKMQMGNPTNFPAQVYEEATTTPLRDKMVYSSYYIEKGSFLRLQNASLGYNFNTKKLGINKLKVYITGENLFVITKYSGMDPELAAENGSGGILAQGIDPGGLAPLIRRFIIGVDVVF